MIAHPTSRDPTLVVPEAWSAIDRAEPLLFWGLQALLAVMLVLAGPILTSDGPAHVSMAHFLRHAGDPVWPVLNRLYEVNPALSPNALGHLMLSWLMLGLSPLAAENVLQGICLIGIPLAARLLLRRLSPSAAWIAVFFIPVALQRMFFLGLYNFQLSLIGCLLCLWAWVGLRDRPGVGRSVVLGVMLLLTLACQAVGWLEAGVAIAAMLAVDSLTRRFDLSRIAATCLACLPSVALFALFARNSVGGEELSYGAPAWLRVVDVLGGVPFAPIGRATALASLVLGATLLGLVLASGVQIWRSRTWPKDGVERGLRLGVCAVPLGFMAFLLVVPERAAGGWSHVWRAEVFPYVGLALVAAVLPVGGLLRRAALALGVAGALVAIAATLQVQLRDAPPVLRDFAEADALIPPHCTIVPVLGHYKLDPANAARLIYHPTFHLAHRMQWRDDRPVLFSYNARLPIYPARFRPDADPQRLLYGWKRAQGDTLVRKLDIPGWEAASGIAVDFVLLWDVMADDAVGPHHRLRSEALGGFRLALRSADGRLELYRRGVPGGCGGP